MTAPVAIFDMDGTLIDSMYYWDRAPACILESMGILPDDEAEEAFGRIGFYRIPEYVVQRYQLLCSPEEFSRMVDDWVLDHYRREILLKPNVKEYLTRLREKGVRCVILTASKPAFIETMLERYHLNAFFTAAFSASALGIEKSNPAIYDVVFRELDCTPGDCTLLDDSDYAVQTAAAVGLRTVGILDPLFPCHHEPLRQHATRVVARYSELLQEDIF